MEIKMEVKMESIDEDEPEVVEVEAEEVTEEDNSFVFMRTLLKETIASKSLQHLKKAIEFMNTNLFQKMEFFFEIKDIYHYFCLITETLIDEQNLNQLVPELKTFYEKFINVCYEYKCLSSQFEGNYRLFNSIQIIIRRLIERSASLDNCSSNECIALMLSSMIIVVSTIYGLKETAVISKPIGNYIIDRQNDSFVKTDEWKELLLSVTVVANICKQVKGIDKSDDKSLIEFTIFYLDLYLGSDPFFSHISDKAIKYLSSEKSIDLRELFVCFQIEISGHVLRLLDMNLNFDNLEKLLKKSMNFFGENTLPSELLRHILPHFAVSCDRKSDLFIEGIAKIDERKSSDILRMYLSDIIRYMFYSKSFNKSFENIEKVLTYLSKATNFDTEYRVKVVSHELINNFLLYLSDDYNSTLEVLAFLLYVRNDRDVKYKDLNHFFNNETELRTTIKEFFLSFIHKFDAVMQDNSVCIHEKMTAINSFVLLMDFMDKHCVNTFRVKLFSTIKLIISEKYYTFKQLIKSSVGALTKFIGKVDESYLSSQLLTISALTLPLMHFWPNETSNIFKELIFKQKNNRLFQPSFKHLYFIPQMNELTEVTEVLKPYITCGNTEEAICEKITLVVNNINHENSKVQMFSLQELSRLLKEHQKLIYQKCNNIKQIDIDFDSFVKHIISQLMVCLKSNDREVLYFAADCLGILGAIDPLRTDLEKPVISREEKSEKFLNFNEKQFKVILITRLYTAITTATKTDDQYSASYALQEVVKYFHSNQSDFKIDDLSQEIKDFCYILLNTKYKENRRKDSVECKPIFGSVPNMSYQEWLTQWVKTLFNLFIFNRDEDTEGTQYSILSQMVSQSSNSSVSDEFDLKLAQALNVYSIKSKVLKACYELVLRRPKVAQFLLPYIVINALKNAKIEEKSVIVREVQRIITTLTDNEFVINNEIGHLSSQTVFHLYDYLKIWHKKRLMLHKMHCTTGRHLRTARLKDREYKGVQFFLENISTKDLAKLAFKCNAYSRSCRYLEEYIKTNADKLQEEIPLFQNVFIGLGEPDAVEGCNSKRKPNNPTLKERISTHEAMGQFQEALICCQKAMADQNDFESQQKFFQISLDSFDQSAMVKTYGAGLLIQRQEWTHKLAPYVIEALWRLGEWNRLEECLQQTNALLYNNFRAGIGDLFYSMIKKSDLNEFEDKVMSLRTGLLSPLSASAMEISGYLRGHKYIVDLHILHDIDFIYNHLFTELNEDVCSLEILTNRFAEVIDIWNKRIGLVRNTVNCEEPILTAQRAVLSILSKRCSELWPLIEKEMFKSWLRSTKTARRSGNIQRSYNCLLEMNRFRESLIKSETVCPLNDIENCEAIAESAKIQWNRNDKTEAIKYLKNEIERNYSSQMNACTKKAVNSLGTSFSSEELNEIRNSLSFGSSLNGIPENSYLNSIDSSNSFEEEVESDEGFAKLQLLYAKFCDRSSLLNHNSLAVLFRSVRVSAPNWEESHYHLAMYCHKLLNNYEESKRSGKSFCLGKPEEILDMRGRVVRSLADSLKFGSKHAHNSLPLMFNIWLDLGSELVKSKERSSQMVNEIQRTVEKMNNAITDMVANVPLFIFFSSFGQLIARILHPYPSITRIIKLIIIKLICGFPQQSIWLLMRSINSQNLNRKNCFKDIVSKALVEDRTKQLNKFIPEMIKFGRLMSDMCVRPVDSRSRQQGGRVKQLSLRKDFNDLAKLFQKNSGFSKILLPFRLFVNVTLPKSFYEKDYNPFPSKDIYIENIDDCIELLHSLQRPKKIKIHGTDGKTYTILCKPGDDLRKDYCLIEFCNLLNRCFKTDAETRRRQLKVKTYLVISLSDNCGLIEWIPGLTPFRTLVEDQYRLTRDYDAIKDSVHRNYPRENLSKPERMHRFISEVMPHFKPSVFGNWFVSTYTDPLSWFAARQAYTRSSAVFSIVGYLLGLGDRHGENILIEELTGETVHVDLNCMFNKGEDLQVPERVPFRLTHNMVHAMGVTEYEGTFRKACEHALRVARENKEALLNFVYPFRFDHLLEWVRNSQRSTTIESTIDQAERIVFNIEARLNGIPSRNERNLPIGISLSVEGQVDHIIKESTDINNLGVMYIGWTPYL